MRLIVVHRGLLGPHAAAGLPVWRTCLREILFFGDEAEAGALGPPLVEREAYGLLLEVICGLQSPMVGETEVMGQFKTFLASLGEEHVWLSRLGQRLLSEARRIREWHLRDLGGRSYGSAVRKRVADCQQVAVIGTGALARELLPFLAVDRRGVDQWGRRAPDDVRCPEGVIYRSIDGAALAPLSPAPTVVVVAAPVPSSTVDDVAGRYAGLLRVIDLRAEQDLGPLRVRAPIVTLGDLFAEMEAARRESARRVEGARMDIQRLSRDYELRDEVHPFGWDDLCA